MHCLRPKFKLPFTGFRRRKLLSGGQNFQRFALTGNVDVMVFLKALAHGNEISIRCGSCVGIKLTPPLSVKMHGMLPAAWHGQLMHAQNCSICLSPFVSSNGDTWQMHSTAVAYTCSSSMKQSFSARPFDKDNDSERCLSILLKATCGNLHRHSTNEALQLELGHVDRDIVPERRPGPLIAAHRL